MKAHYAVLYDDTEDLVARLAALPGRTRPGTVVLACGPGHGSRPAAPFGGHRVLHRDRVDIHSRPAAAVSAYRRLSAAPNVLVIGEPDAGGSFADWHRAARGEAATTLGLDDALTVVCAYPATAPATLLGHVERTHPWLLTERGPVRNPHAVDPVALLSSLTGFLPVPPPDAPARLDVVSVSLTDVPAVRRRVTGHLADVPTLLRTDFGAAVNEVLTNAHQHGAPPVHLKLWFAHGRLDCRITDHGPGAPDPAAGYRHERTGLWLARQACDDLDVWRDDGGFTVRLATTVTAERNRQTAGARARAETARLRATVIARRHAMPFH
ncbi:ATP-binding protein [Amycolatopsis sp. lyj-23]|uniref:ATP-binding protein n=1 Tax=Amycolatopsis sp. lyj-23 TaxID=2789283 RepID=UPI0039785B29